MKCVLFCLFLASCAPAPVVLKPVEVEVPVVQTCKTALVDKPDFALAHVAQTDDVYAKTKAALTEINQRRGYEQQIEAQMTLCR